MHRLALAALLLLAAFGFVAGIAHGAAAGLFAEQSTNVDGVNVRRIRDTSEGVVCYMASVPRDSGRYGGSPTVALSCLRESRTP